MSYLTHDKKRDIEEDLGLHDRLLKPGHMSPFEHPCRPMDPYERELFERTETNRPFNTSWTQKFHVRETHFCGNFDGWIQYRKTIPGEYDIIGYRGGENV